MTAAFANEYEELHRLVDQLPLDRVRALRAIVVHLLEGAPAAPTDESGGRQRRLSFAGIMEAEPDLAERSEEILRDELRQRAA